MIDTRQADARIPTRGQVQFATEEWSARIRKWGRRALGGTAVVSAFAAWPHPIPPQIGVLTQRAMTSPLPHEQLAPSVDAAFRQLGNLSVRIRGQDAVRAYFTDHPDLIQSTIVVASLARTVVPASARISLELYVDPEIEDRYLLLNVRLREYPPTALADIREARRLARPYLDQRSGRLLLTSDFQPAR